MDENQEVKPMVQISTRITPEDFERLTLSANKEMRSLSNMVLVIITKFLDEQVS
jgi:hypothetical protein